MLNRLLITLAAAAFIVSPLFAFAAEVHGTDCASCHKLNESDANELLKKIGVTVTSVKQAPVKGLFELLVEKDGKKGLIFVDYAKKNIIQGAAFNLDTLQPVTSHPLDQFQPKPVTSIDPKSIPIANAVVIGNPHGTKKLYVFTDPDCPFCRKMHIELLKLEKIAPDVAIYIMLYPLAMHPHSFDKARAILEAQSPDLLNQAFAGKEVPKPVKEASRAQIEANIKFATGNGISGTPTMVLSDGKVLVGMRDAETLKKMLE